MEIVSDKNHLSIPTASILENEKTIKMAVMIGPSSSKGSDGKCHIRSISLPSCRLHPGLLQLVAELNNLRSLEASSSDAVCSSLSGLDRLYECMDEVLCLKSTFESLSSQQNEQCINELLNRSLELLDICSSTRESMFQIKEHVRDLQSAMRRRRRDLSIVERSTARYISFRKKIKDAKKLISSLKRHDRKFAESVLQDGEHDHLSSLVRVLREVTMANISVLESLLLFLSASSSNPITASTKWSLVVSRLIKKRGVIASEDSDLNDFTSVDSALRNIFKFSPCPELYSEKMQSVRKKMVALESIIEAIERGLECNFRRLIKTRAFFLNIISH